MRRNRSIHVVVFLLVLAIAGTAGAQERVGRIVAIDGRAEIDAFGRDRFIEAGVGDVLYEKSLLRTDFETWVTAEIDGHEFEIAPNSTSRVSTFLSDRRGGRNQGVLGRLLRSIVGSLAPPQEEVADFGGRASEAATDGGFGGMFITDVNVDEEFAAGQEALAGGEYRLAADHFRRIEYPEDGTFDLTEYYVSLTHSLLGLGDVDAALQAAFEYSLSAPSPETVPTLPARLQLLAAVSAYYAGEDEIALRASSDYVEAIGLDRADPQAVAIRIRLLRTGNPGASRRLERDARMHRSEVDWDALLDE